MPDTQNIKEFRDIKFTVMYSSRKTLSISVLPDSSVIVRAPYRTSDKTVKKIVEDKASWIVKHRDNYRREGVRKQNKLYINGEKHLFRGNESDLRIEKSGKPYHRFYNGTIELGLSDSDNSKSVKALLYAGYKKEAEVVFQEMFGNLLKKFENQRFKPSVLIIRTMKRRWGSCSAKGIITLNTELIKLPDLFVEYVIIHELCHLRHHNHGVMFYQLLSELFPDWKTTRKELRKYIQ